MDGWLAAGWEAAAAPMQSIVRSQGLKRLRYGPLPPEQHTNSLGFGNLRKGILH